MLCVVSFLQSFRVAMQFSTAHVPGHTCSVHAFDTRLGYKHRRWRRQEHESPILNEDVRNGVESESQDGVFDRRVIGNISGSGMLNEGYDFGPAHTGVI